MKIYARGVWVCLGVGTVGQEAKIIALPKGEPLTIELYVTDDAGVVRSLEDATVEFRLVNPLMPRQVLYRTNANDSSSGQLSLGHATLNVNLPASIDAGTYHWEVWMTLGLSSHYRIVPLSAFLLLNSSR